MKKGQGRPFGNKGRQPARSGGLGRTLPPAPAQPPQRKRTAAISIGAIGLTAVTLIGISSFQNTCPEPDPNNPNAPAQNCRSGSSRTGWSSTSSHRSSSSSSSTSRPEQHAAVQRSGFGRTGSSFFSSGS